MYCYRIIDGFCLSAQLLEDLLPSLAFWTSRGRRYLPSSPSLSSFLQRIGFSTPISRRLSLKRSMSHLYFFLLLFLFSRCELHELRTLTVFASGVASLCSVFSYCGVHCMQPATEGKL